MPSEGASGESVTLTPHAGDAYLRIAGGTTSGGAAWRSTLTTLSAWPRRRSATGRVMNRSHRAWSRSSRRPGCTSTSRPETADTVGPRRDRGPMASAASSTNSASTYLPTPSTPSATSGRRSPAGNTEPAGLRSSGTCPGQPGCRCGCSSSASTTPPGGRPVPTSTWPAATQRPSAAATKRSVLQSYTAGEAGRPFATPPASPTASPAVIPTPAPSDRPAVPSGIRYRTACAASQVVLLRSETWASQAS